MYLFKTYEFISQEIFHCINISLTNAWDILLWSDSANFGGVKCPEVQSVRKILPDLMVKKYFRTLNVIAYVVIY